MLTYQINPVLMGGTIKEINENGMVKLNLQGRLGVVTVPIGLVLEPESLRPGQRLQFYFSYLQILEQEGGYDSADLNPAYGLAPTLTGGILTEVNDTAVMAEITGGLGTIAVPRRWVFTNQVLAAGQHCEFYFSCLAPVPEN